MKPNPTVFIVEDDAAMRRSLVWLLESVHLRTEEFASASRYLEQFDPQRPGCLVVDVRMPVMSGLELLERLTREPLSPPMILITGHGSIPSAVRALQQGAIDYLEKPFNDQVLIDRVQHALDLDTSRRTIWQDKQLLRQRLARLSQREHQVLCLILEGQTTKIVASKLRLSTKTVETHRAHIFKKMEVESLPELMRLVLPHQDVLRSTTTNTTQAAT